MAPTVRRNEQTQIDENRPNSISKIYIAKTTITIIQTEPELKGVATRARPTVDATDRLTCNCAFVTFAQQSQETGRKNKQTNKQRQTQSLTL